MNFQCETGFTLRERSIASTMLKKMDETSLSDDLSAKLEKDGYLLLRNVYDVNEVIEARRMILKSLHEVGEVIEPYDSGIFSGDSNRRRIYPTTKDLGEFWKKTSEMEELRRVINGKNIMRVMKQMQNNKKLVSKNLK